MIGENDQNRKIKSGSFLRLLAEVHIIIRKNQHQAMSGKPKRQSELGAASGSRGSMISPFDIAAREVALTEQSHEKIFVEQQSNYNLDELNVMSDFRNSSMRAGSPNILLEDAAEMIEHDLNDEPMIQDTALVNSAQISPKREGPVAEGPVAQVQSLSPKRAKPPVKKKPFNPSVFKFKKKDYNFKQEAFQEAFYNHKKADKLKINQQLVEQTYLQVLNRFEKEKKKGDFPREFRENEMLWAGQMMRSKRLQKIMAEMTHRVALLLDEEIKQNKELIADWLSYPHAKSKSPKANTRMLEQMDSRIYYPEMLPPSCKINTARERQRQFLRDLAARKKQESSRQMINKQVQDQMDVEAKRRIELQVQSRIHEHRKLATSQGRKGNSKKLEKEGMTPFQEEIYDRLQQAKTHLDEVGDLNEAFAERLDDIEGELRETSRERRGKNPGYGVKKHLEILDAQPVHKPDEFARQLLEPVMEWPKVEEWIKNQRTGLHMELDMKEKQYRCRVDGIRNHTSMRIEALESALIETKLKLHRERERAEQYQAEMESTLYNQSLNSETAQRVNDIFETLQKEDFEIMDDHAKIKMMRTMLERLRKCNESLKTEKTAHEKEIKELRESLTKNQELHKESHDTFKKRLEQLVFYQDMLYGVLERTGFIEDLEENNQRKSPISMEKQILLRELMELNMERLAMDKEMHKTHRKPDDKRSIKRLKEFSDQFHEVILEVEFLKIFEIYQNVVKTKADRIEDVTQQMAELGVVDIERLDYRKKTQEEKEQEAEEAAKLAAQPYRSSIRNPTRGRDSKKKKKVNTKDGITVNINEQNLSKLQDMFNVLTKPISMGMNEQLRQKEDYPSSDDDEDDDSSRRSHKFKPEPGNVKGARKSKAEMPGMLNQLDKRQQQRKRDREKEERKAQQKKDRSKSKRGGDHISSDPSSIAVKQRSASKRTSSVNQDGFLSKRGKRDISMDKSIQSRDQSLGKSVDKVRRAKKEQAGDVSVSFLDNTDSADRSKVTSKKQTSSVVGETDKNKTSELAASDNTGRESSAIQIGMTTTSRKSLEDYDAVNELVESSLEDPVKQFKGSRRESSSVQNFGESDDIKSTSRMSPDRLKSHAAIKSTAKNNIIGKKSVSPSPNRSASKQKRNTSQSPVKKKRIGNASPAPSSKLSARGSRKGGRELKVPIGQRDSLESRFSYSAHSSKERDQKGKKMSVLIKKNKKEQPNSVALVHDDDSDDADTEPIYEVREVLDDLQRKVLQKFKDDLEMIEEEDKKFFKLKAAWNKMIEDAFVDSIGCDITVTDSNAMTMTSNLDDIIEQVNEMRDKYLFAQPKGITVGGLGESMRSDYADERVTMAECVLTTINEDGAVTGFSVRPEMMRVILFRNNRRDVHFIAKTIKTVNFLNRIFFKTDMDYLLKARGDVVRSHGSRFRDYPEPTFSRNSSKSSIKVDVPQRQSAMDSVQPMSQVLSEAHQELVSTLLKHYAHLNSKGKTGRIRYEQNAHKDKTLEELLSLKMTHVYTNLSPEERDDMSNKKSSGLRFAEYLEVMMDMLNDKITSLPHDKMQLISVQDLVFEGDKKNRDSSEGDSSDSSRDSRQDRKDRERFEKKIEQKYQDKFKKWCAKKEKELMESMRRSPESRYSMKAMQNQKTFKAKETMTDDSLIEDLLKTRSDLSANVAKDFINQQVAKEMNSTIGSLYGYINQLQRQNKEREEKEKQKRSQKVSVGPASLFDITRKSMATQISSSSPTSEQPPNMVPITPYDQRRAINTMLNTEINQMNEERKQNSLRTAEINNSRRRVQAPKQIQTLQPPSKQSMRSNQINLTMNKPTLPRLGKEQQSIQSERNCTANYEISMMPQLHNSSTKASALVYQPFKQVHVDKHILNVDSTQSKFNSQAKEPKHKRSTTGYNPPGLTAKKFDGTVRSPQKIRENQIPLHIDHSLESKDFLHETSASVPVNEGRYGRNNGVNNNLHGGVVIVNASLRDFTTQGSMLKPKRRDKPQLSQAPFNKSYEQSQRGSVLTPDGSTGKVPIKIDTTLRLPQAQNYVSVKHSMRSTPQSGLQDIDHVRKEDISKQIHSRQESIRQ